MLFAISKSSAGTMDSTVVLTHSDSGFGFPCASLLPQTIVPTDDAEHLVSIPGLAAHEDFATIQFSCHALAAETAHVEPKEFPNDLGFVGFDDEAMLGTIPRSRYALPPISEPRTAAVNKESRSIASARA
jgi:hypothetical protein